MDIYLLQYNNYFNRIVNRENSLRDYVKNSTNYDALSSANFNLNDGVVTSHVFNWCNEWNPDYVIVASEDNIKHRWFVIEWVKRCKGQFKATLRRDVIVDNFETVINAPMFVQKAHLQDNDPMIFNPEGQSYNQIKKSETLLDNGTNIAWAIIYCANNSVDTITKNITVKTNKIVAGAIDIGTTLSDWTYYKYISHNGKVIKKNTYSYGFRQTDISRSIHNSYGLEFAAQNGMFTKSYGITGDDLAIRIVYSETFWGNKFYKDDITHEISNDSDNMFSHATSFLTSLTGKYFISESDYITFKSTYNGKTIKTSDGKYYDIVIDDDIPLGSWTENIPLATSNILSDFLSINTYTKRDGRVIGTPDADSFYLTSTNTVVFSVSYVERLDLEVTFNLSSITKKTENSPYMIFAIPFPTYGTAWIYKNNILEFEMDQELALNACSTLIRELGTACYDVQILPYAPIYTFGSILNVDDYSNYLTYMKDASDNKYGIVFSLQSTKYQGTISTSIDSLDEVKIQSECDLYRLVSPNYAGAFEFNIAKNGGILNQFNFSIDYKPYAPSIIIQPSFGGLYGQNFNDARGLIFSGDFSIPSTSSDWVNYQINNKNYEQVFNRQIEHMDYVNKVSEVSDIAGAITGTFSGAASGALTGAMATGGNPIGAVVGGIAGAGASAIGGAVDVAMSKALRAENKDYAIDNYNYQLGNIKARPYTINKLGCLNNNFKFFPFVEYYTCTDKEKEALRNKIKYSGMTVNRIGTISEFIDSNEKHFIKGQFIRLEELGDDYHMATVICEELMKGEFI